MPVRRFAADPETPDDLSDRERRETAVGQQLKAGAGRAPHGVRRSCAPSDAAASSTAPPSAAAARCRGPAEQWAEELADLPLTEGISTFLDDLDDPDSRLVRRKETFPERRGEEGRPVTGERPNGSSSECTVSAPWARRADQGGH